MVVAYSIAYMTKRHVQSEALKLMRGIYRYAPCATGFALDSGMLEQMLRVVFLPYADPAIITLVCDAAIAAR